MNILLIIFISFVGFFVLLYIGFWIWSRLPSKTFTPYSYTPVEPTNWPKDEFKRTTPEEQGMDSGKLAELPAFYAKKHKASPDFDIDAISVYRNGCLVADYYFNPLYPRDTQHVIHSVTKSIMSAVIGIAIDQGSIDSVDEPFVNFFPEKQSAIKDERMKTVTIQHLLSMQTGIRSRDYALYRWEGLFEMQSTDDWVAHILGLPVDVEPGTRFEYSNMSSFLLSAIIEASTGMDTLEFANKNLFGPMGIKDVRWEWSPKGIAIGYARMWLKPDDMAKFGLLYLQQGNWNGKQLVPKDWVHESLIPHAYPKNYMEMLDADGNVDKELTTTNWRVANLFRPFSDGYGYQWWLDRDGSYSAVGVSGQHIMVVPQKNLIVVVNNSSHRFGVFFPRKLMDKFILSAIVSDEPIDPNPTAYSRLQALAGPPALEQESVDVSSLPGIANEISGKVYKLEQNNWKYDHFKLDFDGTDQPARFSYTAKENEQAQLLVGLNGKYQMTQTPQGEYAAKGRWVAEDTFEMNLVQIGYSSPTNLSLNFKGNTITVSEEGIVGASTYSGVQQ
jgi:CubicO group peptidase (beta-lactamase class C family)